MLCLQCLPHSPQHSTPFCPRRGRPPALYSKPLQPHTWAVQAGHLRTPCAQVLTIHSPFRIENHTSASLEFEVHLFSAPHLRGGSPTSTIPSAGPLLPNLQCYLPTPAIWYHPLRDCSPSRLHCGAAPAAHAAQCPTSVVQPCTGLHAGTGRCYAIVGHLRQSS